MSCLQQGCPQQAVCQCEGQGARTALCFYQPSPFTPAAPPEASQSPQSTLRLYIWILLCFNSTKLLTLSQNVDGDPSLQHTNIPDHKFTGYLTVSQPTCHGEKHQVSLEGNCKSGVFRKSTVSQKYSKKSWLQTDCCQLKSVSHLFWSSPGESCNNNSDFHFYAAFQYDSSKDHWSSL